MNADRVRPQPTPQPNFPANHSSVAVFDTKVGWQNCIFVRCLPPRGSGALAPCEAFVVAISVPPPRRRLLLLLPCRVPGWRGGWRHARRPQTQQFRDAQLHRLIQQTIRHWRPIYPLYADTSGIAKMGARIYLILRGLLRGGGGGVSQAPARCDFLPSQSGLVSGSAVRAAFRWTAGRTFNSRRTPPKGGAPLIARVHQSKSGHPHTGVGG